MHLGPRRLSWPCPSSHSQSALDETRDSEATLCCPQKEVVGKLESSSPTPGLQLLSGNPLPGSHLLICHEFDGRLRGNFEDVDAIAPPERLGPPFSNHLCESTYDAHIVAAGGMDLRGEQRSGERSRIEDCHCSLWEELGAFRTPGRLFPLSNLRDNLAS